MISSGSGIDSSDYCVPQRRQTVEKVTPSCAQCKRLNTRPVFPPSVVSLPVPRIGSFLGEGRDHRKENLPSSVYLLEHQSSTYRDGTGHESFVFQALVRFTNLYDIPESIYSNNAKTFLESGRPFCHLSLLYQNKFGSCNMNLITIPLFSPWFGGTWERS